MGPNQKGDWTDLHIYFSGVPGNNECKLSASRFQDASRKDLKAILTRNISKASLMEEGMEYFVTFYAVRFDKSKTPDDQITRLASKLIYRSNC